MRFLAIDHELPTRAVTNDEVIARVRAASARHMGRADLDLLEELTQSCFASTGTRVRYHRAPREQAVDLTVRAGLRALATAGLAPEDVDLLMYVGIGRGVLEPASATIYQDYLGLTRATAFDVLDACASWARALQIAEQFIASGRYRHVMLVNAEFVGREAHRYELRSIEEFSHWHPSVTIGEAATVTVLGPSDTATGPSDRAHSGFRCDFRTHGEYRDLCFVPMPNNAGYFGKDLTHVLPPPEPMQFVSFGLRLMDTGARQLVEHYQSSPAFHTVPDVILTHSASDGMSEVVLEKCGLPRDRAHLFHHRFANTVSASLPLGMSHLIADGQLRPGDLVLLMTASAGVTTGLTSFTYEC